MPFQFFFDTPFNPWLNTEMNFGPKCQCVVYLRYLELHNQFYMKINGIKKHEYECCFGHLDKRMKDDSSPSQGPVIIGMYAFI